MHLALIGRRSAASFLSDYNVLATLVFLGEKCRTRFFIRDDHVWFVRSAKLISSRLFRLITSPHPDERISERVLEDISITVP